MLASGTSAPSSTATPPPISTKIVSQPMTCGAGTPSACRMAGNASRPLASLAKPCSIKPYPTIRRRGIGAQRASGALLIRSMGRSRHVGDRPWMELAVFISKQPLGKRSRAAGLAAAAGAGSLCVQSFVPPHVVLFIAPDGRSLVDHHHLAASFVGLHDAMRLADLVAAD